jgi:hypothetical protein
VKYLPNAINSIIEVVASNRNLLYKLSDGLKINFDVNEGKNK